MSRFLLLVCSLFWLIRPALADGPSMSAMSDRIPMAAPASPPLPESWIEIEAPMSVVHAAPRDRATALRLSRHIAGSLPTLADELDLPVGNRIHVVVAPTQEVFHQTQPGKVPQWADGTAWPSRGWVFLRAPRLRNDPGDRLETVLDHELVHVLLGRAFQGRPVPRWLQEGVAQLMAGEYTAETTATLANGVLGDNLLSLRELSRGFPRDALRANLAYAQSADFVAYIQNTYGTKSLQRLIQYMARGDAFATAIRRSTGQVVDDIDADWRDRLTSSPLQLAPLMNEGVWWAIGALLVPVAWFSVRRRNRRKVERWKREEVLEEALYRSLERNLIDMEHNDDEIDDAPAGPPIWPIH
jgi:hypothetical protein